MKNFLLLLSFICLNSLGINGQAEVKTTVSIDSISYSISDSLSLEEATTLIEVLKEAYGIEDEFIEVGTSYIKPIGSDFELHSYSSPIDGFVYTWFRRDKIQFAPSNGLSVSYTSMAFPEGFEYAKYNYYFVAELKE